MNSETIAKFAQSLRGPVIGRDHPDYDDARKLYDASIDKRPLVIARCADVADVIAAVNFGRDSKLPIAIRGGGHNGPGLGSVDVRKWLGFVAPANTPPEIVEHLNRTLDRILHEQEMRVWLDREGFELVGGSAKDFDEVLRSVELAGLATEVARLDARFVIKDGAPADD